MGRYSESDSDVEMPDAESSDDNEPLLSPNQAVTLRQRAVKDIDSSLNPNSYDTWNPPSEVKKYSVVTEKPTKNNQGQKVD